MRDHWPTAACSVKLRDLDFTRLTSSERGRLSDWLHDWVAEKEQKLNEELATELQFTLGKIRGYWAIDLDICEPADVEAQALSHGLRAEYVGTPVQWEVYRLTGPRSNLTTWLTTFYSLEGDGEAEEYLQQYGKLLDSPSPAV